MYSNSSNLELVSLSRKIDSYQTWNSHERNGSFHQCNSHLIPKSSGDEMILEKFQYDTLVKLETGEMKKYSTVNNS